MKSANKLLSTSFRIYQNTDSGISNVRTTQYSVPNGLAKFIDFITPTTYFGVPKSIQKPTPSLHASPKRDGAVSSDQIYKFCSIDDPYGTIISPNFQKELYNVGNYTPEVDMGSRAGFVTMDDLFTIYDDLFKFEELLNITKQTITTIPIDEASNNKHRVVITMRKPRCRYHHWNGPSPPSHGVQLKELPRYTQLNRWGLLDKIFSYFHTQPNWNLPQVISISYYT